nr:PD-(D/E)XK nuclease family protein [Natrialba sp. SSL1]
MRYESSSTANKSSFAQFKTLIDDLLGELHVEEQVTLPLEVDDQRVTISGIADLVHETETQVKIIDYKTDSTRRAQSEYQK